MKLLSLLTITLTWLIFSIEALIIDSENQVICSSENPIDCYPKVFVPTTEWQVIREGQDIPGGLHVRLNIDTLQREAKLMDPNEEKQEQSNSGLVISPEQENIDNQKEIDAKAQQEIKSKIQEFKTKRGNSNPKHSEAEINDFGSSVEEVQLFNGDKSSVSRLSQALETLIDLTHDIEFGVKLTADKSIVENLMELIDKVDEDTDEKIYRILGSTLRNNPEAVDNFLKLQSNDVLDNMVEQLESGITSDTIKKRILGVIHALTQNSNFKVQYFNKDDNSFLNKFIALFPSLHQSTKTRVVNIFEDLNIFSKDESIPDSDSDVKVSNYLQNKLLTLSVHNETQFKLFYEKLVELHESNKGLKPTKDFIKWLDEESGLRKQGLRQRDIHYSNTDKDFDKTMMETRHLVFGNPNALRKEMNYDEL